MKNNIKTLCIISNGYPYENHPEYTFVDQIVSEFADNKIRCIVISPYSVSKHFLKKHGIAPRKSMKTTKKGNIVEVYRPRFVSLSYNLFNLNTSMITYNLFKKSVLKELKTQNIVPDAIYGHFIALSGMCAADIGEMLNIPSFLAYGESSPSNYMTFEYSVLYNKLAKLSGIISVSTENKRELISLNLLKKESDVRVIPNGIDREKFYKIDKKIAREKLGILEDEFIVAFVGRFIESKGIDVLSSALDELESVKSFFIGRGPLEPRCKNILYKGTVPNEDLFLYLNAADVFVLPTQAEGCSNAIIEAMACGLPIISSDQAFNDDILNVNNSIRLDVRDVSAIKKSIEFLRTNKEKRKEMSIAALTTSSNLSINQRAQSIIQFIESKLMSQK